MLLPSDFSSSAPLRLLESAAAGFIGFDQRLVGALTKRPDETLPALEKMLFDPPEKPRVSLAYDALNLYRHFRHPSAARFYCDLLAGFGTEVPDFMVEAFCELGPAAVEPLLDYVQSADEDQRPEALFILSTLGVRDERILQGIIRLLEEDLYEGSLFLGVYGDPAGEPALDRALAALKPGQNDERRILNEAKGQLRQGGVKRDLPAFDVFAEYPETAEPVWEVLTLEETLPYLTCGESEWRGSAAMSLTAREDYTPAVAKHILAALDRESDPEVRGLFYHAFFPVAEDSEIRARLDGAVLNTTLSSAERNGALVGLAYHNSAPGFRALVSEAFTRAESLAAAITAALLTNDDHYAPVYARYLDHGDPEIRRCAITGIGKHRQSEHAKKLVALMDDEDADVREEALFAYVLAGIPRVTRKNAEALLADIEEMAGGLTTEELETVEGALDMRLTEAGLDPVFADDIDDLDEAEPVEQLQAQKVGRNDPCPCGSGKKYKKCHGL